MRALILSDDAGHELSLTPEGGPTVREALNAFLEEHGADGKPTVTVEDRESGEGLRLLYGEGGISRFTTVGGEARTEFRVVTNRGDYTTAVMNFARGGFAALRFFGPWWPDVAAFERARMRHEFLWAGMRRKHPRELRRRFDALSRIAGSAPHTDGGFTRYAFGDADGNTVLAWFDARGRGIVVGFDRRNPLGEVGDGAALAELYVGVPDDLLRVVRADAGEGSVRSVPHPDGGAQLLANAIFTFSGPCELPEGLIDRMQREGFYAGDSVQGQLLETVLMPEEFTAEALSEVAGWWSSEEIARGLEAAGPAPLPAPADPAAIEAFCRIWADSGYNDQWDVHYILFEGSDLEDHVEARRRALELAEELGLERVDPPFGAAAGELWIRTDPSIDSELEHWS